MRRSVPVLNAPLLRRIAWYGRRIKDQLNPAIVVRVLFALLIVVALVALIETLSERQLSVDGYAGSFFWALTSLMGNGDPGFAAGPIGGILYVVLIAIGLIMIGLVTGTIIAVIIDFLLKEGQGLGASGFRDHIVICGWNPTAREAIDELRGDAYKRRLVLIDDAERNPAEKLVYYVRGDPTNAEDLARADITVAEAALVFPQNSSNEADMRSILTVMAIESIAPHVRTVVEANNPRHVEHFKRAHADEIVVTPRLASHLVARAALYPGLSDLVTDMVSGGEGSELYRVQLPDDYAGLPIDDVSRRFRDDHHATLLAVSRQGQTHMNPGADFELVTGDEALVVAQALGRLKPVHHWTGPIDESASRAMA
ncbi:MAG: potassium channel family protein [Chloroflexota bacterium]